MTGDSAWRDRVLRRRMAVWEPRIGRTATTTYCEGLFQQAAGFAVGLVWLAITVVLEAVGGLGIVIAVESVVLWPVFISRFYRAVRLTQRSQKEAGAALGLPQREWKLVPVKMPQNFDRWAAKAGRQPK